jgi:hypothetical protein
VTETEDEGTREYQAGIAGIAVGGLLRESVAKPRLGFCLRCKKPPFLWCEASRAQNQASSSDMAVETSSASVWKSMVSNKAR